MHMYWSANAVSPAVGQRVQEALVAADQPGVVVQQDEGPVRGEELRALIRPADAFVVDVDPVGAGSASAASMRGPVSVASAICQHSRPLVVGPSGPSIRSVNVIS
jgi:hypothetical protein